MTSPLSRSSTIFTDRREAGRALAIRLAELDLQNVTTLGLPRGGVPVAAQVASYLHTPLDVIVVRKVGIPNLPEIAMGAIAEHDVVVIDRPLLARVGISDAEFERAAARERITLDSRVMRLRNGRPPLDLTGRTALIVDDGIATGATASAACAAAHADHAARVVVAAPVGSPHAVRMITGADMVVCLLLPQDFTAVGVYYRNFDQTTDGEVERLLGEASNRERER